MADVRTSIDIDAPAQDVWDVITDLGRLGEWVSIHRDFPATPPAEVAAGTTARTVYRLAAENGGPRFSYYNEFTFPAGKVGEAASQVVAGAAEREADDSLARLKQLVEA